MGGKSKSKKTSKVENKAFITAEAEENVDKIEQDKEIISKKVAEQSSSSSEENEEQTNVVEENSTVNESTTDPVEKESLVKDLVFEKPVIEEVEDAGVDDVSMGGTVENIKDPATSSGEGCEIALDLSDDEAMDVAPTVVEEIKPTAEEIQERLRKIRLLKEMNEEKYDYDNEKTEITIDPEFDSEDEVVVESDDFKRYWNTVTESPQDFNSWTYLLQLVEQESLVLTRRAYNSFFKRYPLCYGYWKKFSEVERKNGNMRRARKILELGVRAVPLSVELWLHVTDFYMKHYQGVDAGVQKVRVIFRRAIDAAGSEFRSEKLWKKYINYELESKRFAAVLEIYDRVLNTQTQYYQNFFFEFTEFVSAHNPADMLKEADFEKALIAARESIALKPPPPPPSSTDGESCEHNDIKDLDDLDEAPPGVEDHEKPPNEEELKCIRLQITEERQAIFNNTEQAVTKIWTFEEGIKRPYFHVKQLERAQLKNWREYLDSEITRGDHERIVLLFERCLIACALYEDFWLKYAKYMTEHDLSKARSIYQRACTIHLPKKPNIHMQWAAFEEMDGHVDEAASILEDLDNSLQGMAMIKMRRVAVARRSGKLDVAESFLRSYVDSPSEGKKEELFYTRKLAWFLYKLLNKADEARKLLKDLILKYNSEVQLYSDLIEMEFHSASVHSTKNDEETAMEAFDIALESNALTEDQKFSYSKKKLEFLEDFGLDVKRLQKAYDEHQKLSKLQKKRHAELAASADQPPAKKNKTTAAVEAAAGTNGISVVQPGSAAATTPANGSRYSNTAAGGGTTASAYTTAASQSLNHQTPAGYTSTDANSYYSPSYWNYQQQHQQGNAAAAARPADPHQQYNYWGQYYGQR